MPEGNFLFFLYIPMLHLFPYSFSEYEWKKIFNSRSKRFFNNWPQRLVHLCIYINLFNHCNLLSTTWKKEQFGKYQKPDLHIIIQCYMFYIREWMTKIKKNGLWENWICTNNFFCNFADRFCRRCWKWIEIILKNAFYQNNNTFWIHNSNSKTSSM